MLESLIQPGRRVDSELGHIVNCIGMRFATGCTNFPVGGKADVRACRAGIFRCSGKATSKSGPSWLVKSQPCR